MAFEDVNNLNRADLRDDSGRTILRASGERASGQYRKAFLFQYVVHRDFSVCESEWRDFEAHAIATPFQSFDWLKSWWDAYLVEEQDQTLELNLVFAYLDGELALILPLVVEPFKNIRRLSWVCCHLSDYNMPLIGRAQLDLLDPEIIDHLWSSILRIIPNVDILFLPKQPGHVAGIPNPFYRYNAYDYHLAYHTAEILGDWQAYYTGCRKGKSRARLRSKAKFMRENAAMTITEVVDPEERSQIVLKTIQWKRLQVVVTGAIDPFADVETDLFFDMVAKSKPLQNSLRVFSINASGEPIASAFGLDRDKSFVLYQTAYSPGEFARYSPGVLLLIHMMEKMADEGRDIFDFSIGDEPYKFDWANKHDGLSVTVRTNTLKGYLAKFVILAKLNLKGWIKRSANRFELVKSLRRHVRNLTHR